MTTLKLKTKNSEERKGEENQKTNLKQLFEFTN